MRKLFLFFTLVLAFACTDNAIESDLLDDASGARKVNLNKKSQILTAFEPQYALSIKDANIYEVYNGYEDSLGFNPRQYRIWVITDGEYVPGTNAGTFDLDGLDLINSTYYIQAGVFSAHNEQITTGDLNLLRSSLYEEVSSEPLGGFVSYSNVIDWPNGNATEVKPTDWEINFKDRNTISVKGGLEIGDQITFGYEGMVFYQADSYYTFTAGTFFFKGKIKDLPTPAPFTENNAGRMSSKPQLPGMMKLFEPRLRR
jgi:hypothetical protein